MYEIRSDDARSLWDFHSPTFFLLLLYPTNADEAAASAHPEASTRRGRKKSETMTTTRSDDESRMKWKLTEWPKFLLKSSSSSSYPRFAISFCVFWNEFVIHSSSLTLSHHHSWSVVLGVCAKPFASFYEFCVCFCEQSWKYIWIAITLNYMISCAKERAKNSKMLVPFMLVILFSRSKLLLNRSTHKKRQQHQRKPKSAR